MIVIIFLLEINRVFFDLVEVELEIVIGYIVEYGGFYFVLYYLGEYFYLFFFFMIVSLVLLGGWELFNFLIYFIINDYNLISIVK